jgi:nucleoside-diphosphate-sugar epimerase
VTVNEALAIIERLVGPLDVQRLETQLGDVRHTAADTTLARQELGYAPQVGLAEGLEREHAWLQGEGLLQVEEL